MDKTGRWQHHTTNADEIPTPGARLRSLGGVSASLPLSKDTPSAPFSLAVRKVRLATVSMDPPGKWCRVSAIGRALCAEFVCAELCVLRLSSLHVQSSTSGPRREKKSKTAFSKHFRAKKKNVFSNHCCTALGSNCGFLKCSNNFSQENLTASCHVQCEYDSSITALKKITLSWWQTWWKHLFFFVVLLPTWHFGFATGQKPLREYKPWQLISQMQSLGCTVLSKNTESRALLWVVVRIGRTLLRWVSSSLYTRLGQHTHNCHE